MAKFSKKEVAERATKALVNISANILTRRGLGLLGNQTFMEETPGTDGKTKFPIKKTAANGGVGVAGFGAAVLIKNEYIQEAAKGVAAAGLDLAIDNVVDGVKTGTSGMGNAEKYLSMYDEDMSGDEPVNMAGSDEPDVV